MKLDTLSGRGLKHTFSSDNRKQRDIDFLVNNLFKPPKNDTNYFYYTEVISDWVPRK